KQQLVQLRKIVHPQRDMFAALLSVRYKLPGMTEEHERYFRDVYDHLIRVAEQLDDYRDLASGVTDLYQSTVGNKMNLTMKQLGWVATFFLPLSFLTGFFGQNFNQLVGNYIVPGWTFWVLGIALELALTLHHAQDRRAALRSHWHDVLVFVVIFPPWAALFSALGAGWLRGWRLARLWAIAGRVFRAERLLTQRRNLPYIAALT